MYRILLVVLGLCLTLSVKAEDKAGEKVLTYSLLATRSDLWPTHVKVLTPSKNFLKSDNAMVSPGTTGLLIRIEDGKALIETGRSGVVLVSPNDTDIMAQAEATYRGTGDKTYQLLHVMLGNKMIYWDNSGELAVTGLEGTASIGYYVMLYALKGGEHSADAVALLKEKYPAWSSQGLEVLLMSVESSREEQNDYLKIESMPWKTIQFHMLPGYNRSLALPPATPGAYLLDANGRLLASAASFAGFSSFIDQVDAELSTKVKK